MEIPTASVNCADDRIEMMESVEARSKAVRIFFIIEALRFKRRLLLGERFFELIIVHLLVLKHLLYESFTEQGANFVLSS